MSASQRPSTDPCAVSTDGVVLDTNVVLDWLVFREPNALVIGAQICSGALAWWTTKALQAELDHVVRRPVLALWQPDFDRLRFHWDRYSTLADAAPPSFSAPRCTDADDQKFIDVALAQRARWLVSRDKAVLKLARRCRIWSLEIVTPAAWVDLHLGRTDAQAEAAPGAQSR